MATDGPMRVPVRQLNGKVCILELSPESSVLELKKRVKGWMREEEPSRDISHISQVDLVVGERKLASTLTLTEAGISAKTPVQVVFGSSPVLCFDKASAASAGHDEASLVIVEIPQQELIDRDAFSGCSSLVKVIIPDSVTRIAPKAFKACSSLEDLTLPSSLWELGSEAFQGCSSLPEITIPPIVPVIWPLTFDSCSSLSSLTLGQSVSLIEPQAFSFCTSLRCLAITGALCFIGRHAFRGCSSLKSITFQNLEPVEIPRSAIAVAHGTVPNRVRMIEREAFLDCSSLTHVTISAGFAQIEATAFAGCKALESVKLLGMTTQVADGAFDGSPKIEKRGITMAEAQELRMRIPAGFPRGPLSESISLMPAASRSAP